MKNNKNFSLVVIVAYLRGTFLDRVYFSRLFKIRFRRFSENRKKQNKIKVIRVCGRDRACMRHYIMSIKVITGRYRNSVIRNDISSRWI